MLAGVISWLLGVAGIGTMASEEKRVGEGIDSIGVALIVFSAIVVAFGIWAICLIFDPWPKSPNDLKDRTELVRNIGLFALGIVGLPLAIWRSLTASRQTEEAIRQGGRVERQLALTARQLEAAEENNLAALLQKGAELISDSSKVGQVGAGLATLHSVIVDKNPKYAVEAMNLVADYLQQEYPKGRWSFYESAIQSLAAGFALGRSSTRDLSFKGDSSVLWRPIEGVNTVRFTGGQMDLTNWPSSPPHKTRYFFVEVLVSGHTYDGQRNFVDCTFKRMKITHLPTMEHFPNSFRRCDFSGAKIDSARAISFDYTAGNWFDPVRRPTCPDEVNWGAHFLTSEPGWEIDDGF